jgi:hexulose-6-phosphate isomerase
MDRPLVSEDGSFATETESLLIQLIQNSGDLELGFVELPFMKKNALSSPKTRTQLLAILERALPVAERAGVDILIETDLAPEALVDFLTSCRHPRLGVNYDTGNSTWFGFDPGEELGGYHADIRNIHIKDCTRSLYSVPLGSGETKFDVIFGLLAEFGYRHDFVIQSARQPDDLAAARDYLNVTRRLIDRFLVPIRS